MFMLGNKAYDVAKRLVQVGLPAISALYFGLGQIWGFPEVENVVGSIAIITAFLGTILGISHSNYKNSDAAYDGNMVITSPNGPDGPKQASLELNPDVLVENIEDRRSIAFKVQTRTGGGEVIDLDSDL